MGILPEKSRQIILAHSGLIHAVVATVQNPDRRPELDAVLDAARANGWNSLVSVIRRILDGARETQLLTSLDEDDRVIAEAILRGLQNPDSLPDLLTRPDPSMAGPGLAALIHAAGNGDVTALQLLSDMGTQMLNAGGDLARLSGILRRLVDQERDPELLSRGMSPRGVQLVQSLLEELARLRSH